MSNLISVLIPAYNHEKYIQDTIQSIINQTHKNIELIIIDDGSPDTTLAKINELKDECEKRFTRFLVQTQENQGTCITINKLLDLAQGEYVYLIASDDIATPDALEIMSDFLSKNNDYALVVGENLIIDGNGVQCYWDENRNIVYKPNEAAFTSFSDLLIKIAKLRQLDFLSDDFGSYESLLIGNYIPNGYLIRRSIFEKTGYFTKEAPLEDYYLMLQISKYAKMKYLPRPLFYYRWHDTNTVKQSANMIDKTKQTILYEFKHTHATCKDPVILKKLLDRLETILNDDAGAGMKVN